MFGGRGESPMYQVVTAVSLNPALLSFIRKYCEDTASRTGN